MPKLCDLVGCVFGDWVVLHRLPSSGVSTMWECRCSCGTVKAVRAAHLSSGSSTCCGCKRPAKKHGHARTGKFSKKYRTWRQIRARCLNPNHKNAGIYANLLCEEWMEFLAFDKDVPDPPTDLHTIDRIDNSRGYEPGNVRWVTMAEQHRNQRNCRWIEFQGRRQLLSDWAKEYGVTTSTMHGRIKKWGTPQGRS